MSKKLARALLLLSPIAAALGMFLTYRYSTASSLHLAISPSDVVPIARAQAAAHGVRAGGWRAPLDLTPHNELRHYLATTAPARRADVERVFPLVSYRCILENPTSAIDSVRVIVGPDGRLISWRVPPVAAPKPASVPQARQAAEAELHRRLGSDRVGFQPSGFGVAQHKATSSELRSFTFKRQYDPNLALEALVETSGARVIGFKLTPRLSTASTKRFGELSPNLTRIRISLVVLGFISGFVYVLFRFVRRLREQEIAFKRAVIVAAIVFIAFAFSVVVSSESTRMDGIERGVAGTRGIEIVMLLVVAVIMAALVGTIWGACEADLREAYPEKLTSTDALLGGLFSSRAVRSSLAIGLAVAGWTALLAGLEHFVREQIGGWATIQPGELLPYQTTVPGIAVILLAITGLPILMSFLLVAVSVTHRKGPTRMAKAGLVLFMLLFFLLATFGNHAPAAWSVAFALISTTVILVPFAVGDIVAAIVVAAVSTWATASASLIAQPSASLRFAGWTMLGVLVVAVSSAAVGARRRRELSVEAEAAQPQYARNIVERQMLSIEMGAARQAQLRVMPRVTPDVDGLLLAATRSASADIGSDYYEFFPSATHLSIAVADARLTGLSSALCISMLKGLLLNYATRLTNPRDIADRVHRQLSSIFGDDLPLSFFFGRLDRTTGELLFATFGEIPHAVFVDPGLAVSLEGEEYVTLDEGAVVIYTAPLAGLRDRDGTVLGDEALRDELEATGHTGPQVLLDALVARAAQHSRGVETPQSWTAVAVAMSSAEVTR